MNIFEILHEFLSILCQVKPSTYGVFKILDDSG